MSVAASDPLGVRELRSVADLVTRAAAHRPDGLAIVDGLRRRRWAQLEADITATAAGLRLAGLAAGDRLALNLGTTLDFVEVYLGALRAGLVVVPVNPALTRVELGHVLADSGARGLVTASADVLGSVEALRADHPGLDLVLGVLPDPAGPTDARDGTRTLAGVTAEGAAAEGAAADGADVGAADVAAEDIAVLLYTSGTSGTPRGAMLSHRALLANIAQVTSVHPPLLDPADVVLLPVPLAHIFGLNAGLGIALAFGAATVLVDRSDPGVTLDLVVAEGVSVLVGAPALFAAWAARPGFGDALRGVRLALSGSAPLPTDLIRRYQAVGVALHEGYGLTEAAPVITVNAAAPDGPQRSGPPKAGSVGAPVPGVEVALLDSAGEPVEDGDPGVLVVRGANLFSGYWPDRAGGPDPDGWFRTGDLAWVDGDGNLTLIGRETDMVLVDGFNVYPGEVEAVLTRLPGVAEAAVLGVPDERRGQAVLAYVVPESGQVLDPAVLLAAAARSLAQFKLPHRIEIVAALPHTATGKVPKWRLP